MPETTPAADSPTRRFQWWRWVIVALLLFAFFLRVHRLGDQRVWWDEGWSVWVSRLTTGGILSTTGNDVHPPLYFWLLHLWRSLSGDSEFGLRLLSSFFGTLTVAATFALGRDMGRRSSAAPPPFLSAGWRRYF
ncbi:MAG: glycosyltransferase family 39 protein [Chloroflexota bacterium]